MCDDFLSLIVPLHRVLYKRKGTAIVLCTLKYNSRHTVDVYVYTVYYASIVTVYVLRDVSPPPYYFMFVYALTFFFESIMSPTYPVTASEVILPY